MGVYRRPPRSDELYHYGVLGMKWGVRRYQNPDGTLTSAGRRHYKISGLDHGNPKSINSRRDVRAKYNAGEQHAINDGVAFYNKYRKQANAFDKTSAGKEYIKRLNDLEKSITMAEKEFEDAIINSRSEYGSKEFAKELRPYQSKVNKLHAELRNSQKEYRIAVVNSTKRR